MLRVCKLLQEPTPNRERDIRGKTLNIWRYADQNMWFGFFADRKSCGKAVAIQKHQMFDCHNSTVEPDGKRHFGLLWNYWNVFISALQHRWKLHSFAGTSLIKTPQGKWQGTRATCSVRVPWKSLLGCSPGGRPVITSSNAVIRNVSNQFPSPMRVNSPDPRLLVQFRRSQPSHV